MHIGVLVEVWSAIPGSKVPRIFFRGIKVNETKYKKTMANHKRTTKNNTFLAQ